MYQSTVNSERGFAWLAHILCVPLIVVSELLSLLISPLYLCRFSTKTSHISFHNTTQHYIIHLSRPFTSFMFQLPLVVCCGVSSSGWGPWLFVVHVLTPERRSTSCEVSFTCQTAEGNSEHCLSIKNMSRWMSCCGIWSEKSQRSDSITCAVLKLSPSTYLEKYISVSDGPRLDQFLQPLYQLRLSWFSLDKSLVYCRTTMKSMWVTTSW